MDERMLKEGLAEVYVGGGAVYGPKRKEAYIEMEDKAKKARKGIWSSKKRESAAEYKRRTK
jgi:endonuclease YncB( thermonuclease family)